MGNPGSGMSLPPPLPPGEIPAPDAPPGIQYATPYQSAAPKAWREGNLLVVLKDGRLPMRCVKCNAAASPHFIWRKRLYWNKPVLVVLAVRGGARKGPKIEAGLCERHGRLRRKRIWIGWLIALAGVTSIIVAFALGSHPGNRYDTLEVQLGKLGLMLLVAWRVWAVFATRVLWPSKIEGDCAWLNGACPEYLDSLSPGQYTRLPDRT